MKLLIYAASFYPKVDGVSHRIQNHLRHLKKLYTDEQLEILLLTPDFKNEASVLDSGNGNVSEYFCGVPVIRLPSYRPMASLAPDTCLANPFAIFHLREIILKFMPDVIHFVGPDFLWISFLVVTRLLIRTRIPLLVSYHQMTLQWINLQPISDTKKTLLRYLFSIERSFSLADIVITPSLAIQQYLMVNRGIRCDGVWPPAIDTRTFDALCPYGSSLLGVTYHDYLRKLFTFDDPCFNTVPILLYVGRMCHEKSIDWLLEMMQQFRQTLKPSEMPYLVLIGTGALHSALKSMHGRSNNIYFSDDFWKPPLLSWTYSSADIFVMPSEFESLGNVCLEAMASGLAVVARNKGGVPDIVHDSSDDAEPCTGLLANPDTVEGLSSAVLQVMRSRRAWIESRPRGLTKKALTREIFHGSPDREDNLYVTLVRNGYNFSHDETKSWRHATQTVATMYHTLAETQVSFGNPGFFLSKLGFIVASCLIVWLLTLWH